MTPVFQAAVIRSMTCCVVALGGQHGIEGNEEFARGCSEGGFDRLAGNFGAAAKAGKVSERREAWRAAR
jgi:hypothetical protein